MRQISIYEAPIEINGLLSDYHKGHLWKMPEELWGKVSDWIDMMGIRATGGRVRFRTNSKKLYLRSTLQSCTSDTNFTIVGSAACDVIRGRGVRDAEYIGLVVPPAFGTLVGERTIELPGTMEDYTIYFPRNEAIEDLELAIDDDAELLPPRPTPIRHPCSTTARQ